MDKHALSDKLRRPAADKPKISDAEVLRVTTACPQTTPDGQLTFAGVYCVLFADYQKMRGFIQKESLRGDQPLNYAPAPHVCGAQEDA